PPRLVSAQVWYSPAAIRVADDADCAPCATGVTENARLAAARNATPVAATAVTPTPSRSLNCTPPSRLGQRRITSGGNKQSHGHRGVKPKVQLRRAAHRPVPPASAVRTPSSIR